MVAKRNSLKGKKKGAMSEESDVTRSPLKSRDTSGSGDQDSDKISKLQNGCQEELLEREEERSLEEDPDQTTTVQKTIILVGVLYNAFLTLGMPFSFSTFFPDLLDIFDSSRWEASLVQSLFMGVTTGAGAMSEESDVTRSPLMSRDTSGSGDQDSDKISKLQNGCQEELLEREEERSLEEDPDQTTTVQKTIILVGVLYNAFLTLGMPFSFSTFFPDLLDIFYSSRWEASLVQSLFMGVTTGAGIPVGFLIQRFGIRTTMAAGSVLSFLGMFCSWFATSLVHLIVTVGVITGFGGCMVYVTSTVVISAAFRKRKGVVMTTIAAMAGIGPVVFPKLMEALMTLYGLKGTLLIFSACYLNILVTSLLVTPSNHRLDSGSRSQNETFMKRVGKLMHPVFLSYCFTSLVSIACFNAVFVLVIDFCYTKGISKKDGIDFLLIINALVGIVGILVGFLKLIPRVHGVVVYCLFTCLCALGIMVLPVAEGYGSVLACFCLYGISLGGCNGVQMVGVLDIVGHELLAFGIGVRGIFTALGNPVGAVFTGWLYDVTGSYTLPFRVTAALPLVASALSLTTISFYTCCRR